MKIFRLLSITFISSLLVFLLSGCKKQEILITQDDAKALLKEHMSITGFEDYEVVTVRDQGEEGFKFDIEYKGENLQIFVSKDGKTISQPGETEDDSALEEQLQEQADAGPKKTAKPKVEVYTMSHCPHSVQLLKGLIPVLKRLGSSIDFQLKFSGFIMHGQKELDEQLNQYCINKEYKNKLIQYLECYINDSEKGEECLSEIGIQKYQLQKCISDLNADYQVSQAYSDREDWIAGLYPPFGVYKEEVEKYNIKGSPIMIVNETRVDTGRDSQSLLDTICSGFSSPPSSCNQEMDTEIYAPGFGWEARGGDDTRFCDL